MFLIEVFKFEDLEKTAFLSAKLEGSTLSFHFSTISNCLMDGLVFGHH